MRIVRSLALSLAGLVLYSALSFWLLLAPLASKLGDPQTPKQWLEESRATEGLTSILASQLTSQQAEPDVNISAVELSRVIDGAVPPPVLQGYAYQIIDGVYAWLRGETDQPQFRISLADRQSELQSSFSRIIRDKLQAAPGCSTGQLRDGYDPLQDVCLPSGQSPDSVARAYTTRLFDSNSPLQDATLDGKDLIAGTAGGEEHPMQRAYAWLRVLPWILLGVTILCAILLILLSQPRKRGLQLTARRALVASLSVSLSATFFVFILPRLLHRTDLDLGQETLNVSAVVEPLVRTASRDLAVAVYTYSLPVLFGSIITLLIARHLSRSHATSPPTFSK